MNIVTPINPRETSSARLLGGKVAIVTGAGSGIGRGIAQLFAREGAKVKLGDLRADGGQSAAQEIREAGGEATFLQGDVAQPEYHAHLVYLAKSHHGRLDIAVNNAGISLAPTPVAEIGLEIWDRVVGVNLTGLFFGVRAQIPAMLEAGGGSIVNIASAAGLVAMPGIGAYVAAKHGVVGLTKSVAVEYAQQGIRANAIAPGFIDTRLSHHFPPEQRAQLAAHALMNRLGTIDEVARLALFLASENSSFVTGVAVPIDGGTVAQ